MSGGEPPPSRGVRQAARWARQGRLHADSAAIVASLDGAASRLLYWWARNLDPAAEPDDVVQILALAELEARATPDQATGTPFRLAVQRTVRRETWAVSSLRGDEHRAVWRDYFTELAAHAGDEPSLEEIGWDEIVGILRWWDGLAVWLWAVEEWTLEEIGALHGLTKQQAWRRLRRGLAVLRQRLPPPTP